MKFKGWEVKFVPDGRSNPGKLGALPLEFISKLEWYRHLMTVEWLAREGMYS